MPACGTIMTNFMTANFISLRWLAGLPLAGLFLAAGYGHFAHPKFFVGIMRGLPFPHLHSLANRVSGAAEIAGGAGLLLAPFAHPVWATRCCTSLLLLLAVMSVANVNMYVNDVPAGKKKLTYGFPWGTHYIRAYAQIILFAWIYALRNAWGNNVVPAMASAAAAGVAAVGAKHH